MAIEIERKYLVTSDAYRQAARAAVPIKQGYLATGERCVVRVRTKGPKGYLTVKGSGRGLSRPEFETEIPLADAEAMLATLCRQPVIDKVRYLVDVAGMTWEVDEFFGDNAGLVVAELELSAENEVFAKPDWVGLEVTDDERYANARLAEKPFTRW